MTEVADKPKVATQHRDKLDNILEVGTHVAYPSHNQMIIGVVVKITPKMVTVRELGVKPSAWYGEARKYPSECIKVEGPKLTMYILKKSV